MNAYLLRVCIAAVVCAMAPRLALSSEPFVLPVMPNLDELKHAGTAIPYYIISVRPWWTCKYEWRESRREPNAIVYRVTFPGTEKCSRSKRTEVFDLFYSRKVDKVIKMVPVAK